MMIQVRRAHADEVKFPNQVFAYINPYQIIALMPKSKTATQIVAVGDLTLDVTEDINVLASRIDKAVEGGV